jgi:hypothetical protein
MAKAVVLKINNEQISFSPIRVDRSKIYGSRKRIAMDELNRPCTKAALTADGAQLLVSGMVSQAYFTKEGRWVTRGEMVGIDSLGNIVETKASTLGVEQVLEGPVDASEVLNINLQNVYYLEPEIKDSQIFQRLKMGEIFKFKFNYAAGLEEETAYLISNEDGYFALVGKPFADHWIDEGEVFIPVEEEEADDLDFEAL